jgi:hypothetical protein
MEEKIVVFSFEILKATEFTQDVEFSRKMLSFLSKY